MNLIPRRRSQIPRGNRKGGVGPATWANGVAPFAAPRPALFLVLTFCLVLLLPVAPAEGKKNKKVRKAAEPASVEDLQIVDCLLPGQVRQLGRRASFVTARRPIRTTTTDCEIRGGEYVAFDRSSYASALAVWLPAAEAGDPAAQTYVGEIFEKGLASTPDHAAAAVWYQKAADQGFARGEINLAHLYESGLGVAQDKEKALTLYRQAAGISEAVVLDQREEVAALRSQVEEVARESEELRRELAVSEQGLEAARSDLEAARQEVEGLHERLEAARKAQARRESAASGSGSGPASEDTATLAAALERQQAKVAERTETVRGLSVKLSGYRDRMAKIEAAQRAGGASAAGPTIEIVRPDVLLTRGPTLVTVPEKTERMQVTGKVTAPAGLGELTLDGRALALDAGGFFEAEIPFSERKHALFEATDRLGKSVTATLVLVREGSGRRSVPEPAQRRLRERYAKAATGNNHALVISVTDYQNLPKLSSARADGEAVRELLEGKYGFQVTLLEDPSSVQVFLALDALRRKLGPESNLLIYYAGHGKIGDKGLKGYWIPADGDADDDRKWISNEAVSDMLDIIPAKHVLVVSDSCYSGTLTRSSVARVAGAVSAERERRLDTITGRRSRTVLTSGGLQPVLDQGGDGHSLFASAFLNVLEQNDDILLGVDLHREVAARVRFGARALGVEQKPDYAPIRYAGHEAGDFTLVPRSGAS